MFIGIAFVAGVVIGVVFGKTILSDAYQIKAHITNEISALEKRLKGTV
jgi:uncharacterized membrane-anchored protein YhcB (DUF1043 family)